MSARSTYTALSAVTGAALGGVFRGLAHLRRGKPLHPRGVVFDAVVRRTGTSEPWGVEWLDAPGEDRGLARLSRAVGLPSRLPDIHGLALTFTDSDGARYDLLLATTGVAPVSRFVLVPTWDARQSFYGSLFPYETPRGPVLLAAVPKRPVQQGASFRLLAAGLLGRWRQFATLELTERHGGTTDEPVRFDPVLHVLPGLRWPPPLARLREPAYEAARRTPARAVPGAGRGEAQSPEIHLRLMGRQT